MTRLLVQYYVTKGNLVDAPIREGHLFRWTVGPRGELNVLQYGSNGEFIWTKTYRDWHTVELSS
jgi:hypothetical protein